MGRRSDGFERRPRDFYPTPRKPVMPLIPFIGEHGTFCEPCAGDGALIEHIEFLSDLKCVAAYDLEPQVETIVEKNAFDLTVDDLNGADCILTNPPWIRELLHPMIDHFRRLAPTWLLFDAGWKYTGQSKELIRFCHAIVPVGRVKWIEGTNMTGKEDAAWYCFKNEPNGGFSPFYPRR